MRECLEKPYKGNKTKETKKIEGNTYLTVSLVLFTTPFDPVDAINRVHALSLTGVMTGYALNSANSAAINNPKARDSGKGPSTLYVGTWTTTRSVSTYERGKTNISSQSAQCTETPCRGQPAS